MIVSRYISNEKDLTEFSRNFTTLSGNYVSNDYLSEALVIAYYIDDIMVAGFVINKEKNIRYFQWIPENKRQEVIKKIGYPEKNICEITCIWMNRNKIDHWQRLSIYRDSVMLPLKKTNAKIILGGSHNKKVAYIQRLALPFAYYNGEGSSFIKNKNCSIYYSPRRFLLLFYLRAVFVVTITDYKKLLMKKIKGIGTPKKGNKNEI